MCALELSSAQLRAIFNRVTELSLDYLKTLGAQPSFPGLSGEETARLFDAPPPEHGLGMAALDSLADVLRASRAQNARFFGYVMGSGEPVGAAADLLTSVLNANVTSWRSAPAGASIERTVVGWLAGAVGCKDFAGTLTGGGSAANLMGLAMAREALSPANEKGAPRGVIYASAESHMSIAKAVALLGLGRRNLRLIETGGDFRILPARLEAAIRDDRRRGRRPLVIVGCAGTVNTGAMDPLRALSRIARRHRLWFHVDGAYGALAALAFPEKFDGLALADSVSLDPHKWLYQPLDCGCLLYRDAEVARKTFSHTGEYARSLGADPIETFSFFDESPELSRRFRALKLWLSMRYHGLAAFREAIRQDLAHARALEARIAAEPRLELLATGELSAVCFRYVGEAGLASPESDPQSREAAADSAARPTKKRVPFRATAARSAARAATAAQATAVRLAATSSQKLTRSLQSATSEDALDALNAKILERVIARRRVYLSNARIRGRFALRACFINHRTTSADVEAILSEVLAASREVG